MHSHFSKMAEATPTYLPESRTLDDYGYNY
jgi:hypothetical protein